MEVEHMNTADDFTELCWEPTDCAAAALVHPLTKECPAGDDVDSLIDAYAVAEDHMRQIGRYKDMLRQKLAEKAADQTTKTRRLRGKSRMVRIEMPDTTWLQSQLKEA